MALNNELSINLGLPAMPLVQDQKLFPEFVRVYNAIKQLATALDRYTGIVGEPQELWDQIGVTQCTVGINSKVYLTAGEAISRGNLVGIDLTGRAFLAEDQVLSAVGFCTAPGTTPLGHTVEIQLLGMFPLFPPSTLSPGEPYYCSSTPGLIGPVGSGTQCVGIAITDQALFFNPSYPQ